MMKLQTKKESVLRRIICLALVVIMLTSNFITPIKVIADEINESEKVESQSTTELNEDDSLDKEKSSSNFQADKGETFIDKKDELGKSDVNKEDSNTETSRNEEQSNIENEENSGNEKNVENVQDITSASESAGNQGIRNLTGKNVNRGTTLNNASQTNSQTSANNTQTTTSSLDELKERIKPTSKDNLQVKTKNDNYEINTFKIDFAYGASIDSNGNLVWTPENSAKGHEFSFRVNYAISGLKELPAEAIQITIPKSILRNRLGNLDDTYEMSLPTSEEYDGTTDLAYIENEDFIIVYNPKEIKAGMNGYFEVAYATNSQTYEYKDYDKTKTQSVSEGGTASDPFYAVIKVKTGEDELTNVSDEKNVFIDTHAKIVSTQKRYPNIYREWNTSWMEETPEDSDKYYYLVWEIRTYIEKDPTQYYNFTLEDIVKDLTNNSTGEDYQIVGYKLAGNRYYTTSNTQANQTRDEYRYDYVLTRHKIETYKDIEYTLKNTVTAVVDPIDQVDSDTKATSSNQFFWDPGFTPPTGHFNLFKYGNNTWYDRFGYYWDYANYDLDKFQKEEMEELDGLKYFTETIGYAYPWTLKEGGSLDKPEDYGYNAVKYVTWDDKVFLEGEETPMTADDYYLQSLTYSITNNGAMYDDFQNKFIQTSPTYEDNEKIIFYGKIDGEWKEIGTYNLKENTVEPNAEYTSEMTTSKITLKVKNCTGWKFETSNKHYYTYIVVEPTFALKNSSYVKGKIANKDSIKIQNNVSTKITDYKDTTLFEKETSGIDYARVTYYDSQIKKIVSSVSNNAVARNYSVTWKVNAWEKATSGSGQAEYIRQNSGKFYDLIPIGGEIDVNSIQVENENGFLPENEYTYEVILNYNDSGRTMLIISIDTQAQYYNVYYKTVHSWESMKDYGRKVLNPVAYETGNGKITNGSPDDGGNLSTENKELFVNLDEETDDNKFIYAEQTYNINAVTAAVSGLYKKVKNSKETDYSYETQVEPNGKYSYQLRYQNTYINKAKNLVLFDSLENFKIVDSEAGTTTTSGWKGTLLSIDLNQLKAKGIAPVVYISTVEDLDLENNHDLTDTLVWKRVTAFTDLSNATAIAIDMTKDIFGNEFILETGESVSAVLHMKAPTEVPEGIENNPYTYNNIYIKNTLIDELSGTEDFFIHQDYTKVKYHVIADVLLRKVNEQDENEGIKDITFRLYGTSNYGTEVDEYVTSDKNGNVKFEDIEAGEYILQEYEATPDWVEDHTEHRAVVDNNGKVKIDDNQSNILMPVKITNKPRAHTDVTFTKRNLLNNFTIEGAKFKLEGTSNYGNEILMYATSDENGNVKFENVEYGTYDLKEIEVPDGYIPNQDKYRVIVDENGNYDIGTVSDIVKYLHTSNINDSGNQIGGPFTDEDVLRSVTIPGAKSLHVDLTYAHHVGWFAVYDGKVTPTLENFDESVSGKLSGYSGSNKNISLDINGDTVQIYFNRDTSPTGGPYGYYAVITAYNGEFKSIYDNGKYNIYNEPLHSFRVVKKDSYDKSAIVGAKFKLTGTSNYGTDYDMEVTSASAGITDFTGLESGTYLLKETYVPEVTDSDGNTITYKLDDKKYAVSIDKNGTVTINGLEKNENGNFEFLNDRQKGQITITKKWMDNSDNENRPDPVVHISTEKPQKSKFVYFRNNYYSYGYQSPLCWITNGTSCKDSITGEFRRNTDLTEEQVIALGAKRLDINYNDPNAEYKIYGWIDNSGNCYWWSNAEKALMTDNSNKMFYGLNNVKSIDTTDIDTSKVTNMSNMFYICSNITNIDVSSWDTSNVTDMSSMFSNCSNLTEIDVSNFDTSNVTNMSCMFNNCQNLTELDVSKFDTSNVTNMKSMFSNCSNFTEIDVSNFDTSNVKDMSYMFYYCQNLTELDLSKFDTSNVTSMSNMFDSCTKLTDLDISNFDTSNVTNMKSMFSNCSNFTEIDVSKFDTSNVTNMGNMFASCTNLTELDVSKFDTSKVTSMYRMFSNCKNLTELDVSKFDTSNVTNMENMFASCTNLTELDVSKFDTSKVTSMYRMFYFCENLTELDVSNFDTSKVTDMSAMFSYCRKLTELDLSKFDTSNVTYMKEMFYVCENLTELDVSNFDTSKVTDMSMMFSFCTNLTDLDVSNFDTSKVTNMSSMFSVCRKLTELDLSKFDTSKVTDMGNMFNSCSNLTSIYASGKFITNQVTNSRYMFDYCNSLKGGNSTRYNSSYTDKTYARIDKPGQPGYFTYKAPQTASTNYGESNNNSIVTAKNIYNENNYDEIVTISKTQPLQTKYMSAPNTADGNEEDENEVISYSTDTYCDESGNKVEWVKNGDTWTYTFYVDDPYATWYVWEEDVPGYSSNYTEYYPGKVEKQKATIINTKVSDDYIMGDTEPNTGLGSLSITKQLVGKYDDGSMSVTTEDNTPFVFHVQLTPRQGYESFISGTKVFGDTIFINGQGTLKVRPGETVTIPEIPIGTSYKVTEESNPDYKIEGYTDFSVYGASGTISKSTTVVATNFKDYQTSSTTPVEEEKFVNIALSKKVTGNYEVEGNYNFEIALSNLKPNTIYSLSDGTTFTSDSTGSANVTVSLGNDDTIILQNIPVGSKYKVYEHAGYYISSYVITDTNDKGLINNTSNNNTKENTALSTATETADEDEEITITFTNKKTVTQNLKLEKVVTDVNDTNSYIFEIEFANMKSGTSFNSSIGKVTADSNGTASLTAYLAGGDEAEFYNVPVGTTYKVTELASNAIASYSITDKNVSNKIANESNANTSNKTALSTEEETVNEGEEVTVTFTNDTVNQEPDSISTSLGVSKKVLNMDGTELENCEDTFTFEIISEDDAGQVPEHQLVQITGNGQASFGTITFTETGTYTYKITEKAGDVDYYNYDKAVYTVVYEVTNPEGLLEITKSVKKDGFEADVIEFTNKISKADIKILKTDEEGNSLKDAVIQILDSEGSTLKSWTTTSKDVYTLKLAPGTYTMHEAKAPEGYEVADDIIFTINEDGTVSVNDEKVDVIVMKDPKVEGTPDEENYAGNDESKNSEYNNEEVTVKKSQNIKTGDNVYAYITMFIISGFVIAVVVRKK